jgi:hypothetical protein
MPSPWKRRSRFTRPALGGQAGYLLGQCEKFGVGGERCVLVVGFVAEYVGAVCACGVAYVGDVMGKEFLLLVFDCSASCTVAGDAVDVLNCD